MLTEKAKELMKSLLNYNESYGFIKDVPLGGETLALFIQEKKKQLIEELKKWVTYI